MSATLPDLWCSWRTGIEGEGEREKGGEKREREAGRSRVRATEKEARLKMTRSLVHAKKPNDRIKLRRGTTGEGAGVGGQGRCKPKRGKRGSEEFNNSSTGNSSAIPTQNAH